jgi:hypothetical protein
VNLIKSVRDMGDLKSDAARGRAWIRMALMEQTLSQHWQTLVTHKAHLAYVPSILHG